MLIEKVYFKNFPMLSFNLNFVTKCYYQHPRRLKREGL